MKYREFGRTGWKVSEIGFGTWAIGSSWGPVEERESVAALNRAVDLGINFFDTADAYGSEPLLAKLRRSRSEPIYIVTKLGRRLNPHVASGFTRANMTAFVNDSLKNLDTDTIDLIQLHCPPTEIYYRPEVFGILDDFVKEGKIRFYGVSVEKIDEALKAIEYPNVQSVQIIFNIFRQRPAEDFFPEAKKHNIAILARVPLASGLLTGKMTRETSFPNKRSPELQSPRRVLRPGRDIFGRRLQYRLAGRRGIASACAARGDDGSTRVPLDSHA